MSEYVKCLFCQKGNDTKDKNCTHCGMPLTTQHPDGKGRTHFFIKAFIGIVLFCLAMIYYLPR